MALTAKQQRFVDEYLVDLNATQAAVRAGYSAKTAEQQASRLLRNVQVQTAVNTAKLERSKVVGVTAADVMRELARIALVDIGEAYDEQGRLKPLHLMPADVRRAIAGVESFEEFESDGEGGRTATGDVRKVKFWDKPRALELLGKHFELFTEKVKHEGSGTILVVDPYAVPK